MADEVSQGEDQEFLPGSSTLTEYTQQALRTVLQATKCSNELPATGDDFDYYSSFQGVREVLDIEGNRILNIIQSILKYQSVKGNLLGSSSTVDLEDKFDVLIDANDQILERVGSWLDEASGVKKQDTTLIVASTTPKQHGAASWNKKTSTPGGNTLSSYRLLAARNIQRPQMKFKDKIDNENRPFVPHLKEKFHALKSLEESMKLGEDVLPETVECPSFQYPHPYQYELDHFTPEQKYFNSSSPKDPKPLGDTKCTLVKTRIELQQMCDVLKSCEDIAVDLEHHSYRTFQGITCLMQISTRSEDFIIDTLALRNDLHILNEIFADPCILKVLHGADMDIGWLQRDLGLYIVNMFDTGQAARVLNMSRHSLAHLLEVYCNVQADKQFQLADWRIRPLPEELIKYAREDTHYLLYIYDRMRNELLERGNEQKNLLHSVIQKSTRVCAQIYRKPLFTEDMYMELYRKSKKVFNSRQLAALKNLYTWRDRIARLEDESIGYVLPNHMMLQISEILPRERQGVLACCNPIPPLVRQYLVEIHNIIMEAREVPLSSVLTPKAKEPSSYKHPKYNPDSLLNCSHDMTYQHKYQDLGNTQCLLDTALLTEKSSMFGESSTSRNVLLKNKPLLTVFDDRPPKELSNAQRIAAAIRATFVSPLTQFLPDDKEDNPQQIFNSWKLMKHTPVKRKEPSPTRTIPQSTGPPPAKRQKVEVKDTGGQIQPISKLKSSSKGSILSNAPEQGMSKKKKKRKMDNQKTEQTEDNFTPYDYSAADLQMFKECKKKGQGSQSDVFDPNAGSKKKGKGGKVYKPQFSTAKSQKSSTFGVKDKSQKTKIWPK